VRAGAIRSQADVAACPRRDGHKKDGRRSSHVPAVTLRLRAVAMGSAVMHAAAALYYATAAFPFALSRNAWRHAQRKEARRQRGARSSGGGSGGIERRGRKRRAEAPSFS